MDDLHFGPYRGRDRMSDLDFDDDPVDLSVAEQHVEPSVKAAGTLSPLEKLIKAEKQAQKVDKKQKKQDKQTHYQQQRRR